MEGFWLGGEVFAGEGACGCHRLLWLSGGAVLLLISRHSFSYNISKYQHAYQETPCRKSPLRYL